MSDPFTTPPAEPTAAPVSAPPVTAAPVAPVAAGAAPSTPQAAPDASEAPKPWHSDWVKADGTINHESYSRLPENLKHLAPSLANVKTPDDMLARISHLTNLAGKKGLGPLPANAPPD